MTREELRDYVDEQRTLDNIPYHVYSTLIDGIDTLEQEPILDKLRAEIKHFMYDINPSSSESDYACNYILQIIDKYNAETEEI